MCQTFQAMGIGCAATNYRLAPGHKWPAQPMDVAAAFGWLKNNIAKRGGDPRRIFLFGHSSGCLLVSMVAADSTYLATQRLTPHDVAGVIAMGCRLDDVVTVTSTPPAAYESSSVPPDRVDAFMKEEEAFTSLSQRNDAVPASHITAGLPPTLVLVAEGERFFPPVLRDGAEFVGRAQALSVDADLAILSGRTHRTAIQEMIVPGDPGILLVAGFVNRH
jgi:acetyl esterase/lipase